MAKISKKTGAPSLEIENLNQFIFEGVDEADLFPRPEPITHVPSVDMYSTSTDLIVEVEMPGVRRDDIEVLIHRNTITVKALKVECFEEERINYVCMERSFGRVMRVLEIPFPVDSSRIKASYRNGILVIIVPKVEDKRSATRRVPIEE